MEIGVFTKIWNGLDLDNIFEIMVDNDIFYTQFNMSCVGEKTIPDKIDYDILNYIEKCCNKSNIKLSSISGTFNIILEDNDYFLRFRNLVRIAKLLQIPCITICTGTMNEKSMWESDSRNSSGEAWERMLIAVHNILKIASEEGIIIGIEPEVTNIISNAFLARKVLDYFNTEYLKIVMDGANLLPNTNLTEQEITLSDAFNLLGKDICIAHGKDYSHDGNFVAAGDGILDYSIYLKLLNEYHYDGPLILHQILPQQIYKSIHHINRIMNNL